MRHFGPSHLTRIGSVRLRCGNVVLYKQVKSLTTGVSSQLPHADLSCKETAKDSEATAIVRGLDRLSLNPSRPHFFHFTSSHASVIILSAALVRARSFDTQLSPSSTLYTAIYTGIRIFVSEAVSRRTTHSCKIRSTAAHRPPTLFVLPDCWQATTSPWVRLSPTRNLL
jgi:hypothetical protein